MNIDMFRVEGIKYKTIIKIIRVLPHAETGFFPRGENTVGKIPVGRGERDFSHFKTRRRSPNIRDITLLIYSVHNHKKEISWIS